MTKLNEITLSAKKSAFNCTKITSSSTAAECIRQFYGSDINLFESFFLLLLNRANKTIGYVKISQGGVCGTVVDPKIVAKYAIDSLASSVILSHNHPSGELRPSAADQDITLKIVGGLKLFDIQVLDHLILSDESFFSFKDEGYL